MLIRTKLLAAFGGMSLLAAAIVAVALMTFADVLQDAEQMQHTWMQSANQLDKVSAAVDAVQAAGADPRNDLEAPGRELRLRYEMLVAELDVLASSTTNALSLVELEDEPDEVEQVNRQIKVVQQLQQSVHDLRAKIIKFQQSWLSNRRHSSQLWKEQFDPIFSHDIVSRLHELHSLTQRRINQESAEISESIRQSRLVILLGAGGILISAFLLGVHVHRTIAEPLSGLKRAVEAVGRGERRQVTLQTRTDELEHLALAFNQMTSQLEATTVSKSFVDTVLASMPGGLVVLNSSGEVLSVNASAAALFQSSSAEIVGRPFARLVSDAGGHATFDRWLGDLALAGSLPAQEWACRHPDGRSTSVLLTGAIVTDSSSQRQVLLCGLQDITARKAAEAETARLNRELVRSSRLAGMAEVATGVLHNVGNVLTSANVSANLMAERLGRTRTASLSKVVALLRQNQADLPAFLTQHPQGRQIAEFLDALAQHLTDQQAAFTQELKALQGNLDHIKNIVAMQQSYAGVSGALETVPLREVIEDALSLTATSLHRHHIDIDRVYAEIPAIVIDRHKVLQILVNLLQNAKQALASRAEGKHLTIRLDAPNPDRVRIEVTDNGPGISRENLTRIFAHGFTTKEDGHGFGLHSGANAAREMGGSLTAASDGLDRGATFTLELPMKTAGGVRPAAEAAA